MIVIIEVGLMENEEGVREQGDRGKCLLRWRILRTSEKKGKRRDKTWVGAAGIIAARPLRESPSDVP